MTAFYRSLINGLERRINAPIPRIALRHRCNTRHIWGNSIAHTNHSVAGIVNRGPQSRAYSRENSRTVGSTFLGFYAFHFVPVDIRLNLAPQPGACSAATEADTLHRD